MIADLLQDIDVVLTDEEIKEIEGESVDKAAIAKQVKEANLAPIDTQRLFISVLFDQPLFPQLPYILM